MRRPKISEHLTEILPHEDSSTEKKRGENRRPEKKKERKVILQRGKKCKCLKDTQSQAPQGGTTKAETAGWQGVATTWLRRPGQRGCRDEKRTERELFPCCGSSADLVPYVTAPGITVPPHDAKPSPSSHAPAQGLQLEFCVWVSGTKGTASIVRIQSIIL